MSCPLISAVVGQPKSHYLFCFHYAYIASHSILEVIFILVNVFLDISGYRIAALGGENIRIGKSSQNL